MTAPGRILFCIACLVAALSTNYAQDRAIRIGSVVDGELAVGEEHRYSLTALELTLVSFRVQALSEGLDPMLEIFDHRGRGSWSRTMITPILTKATRQFKHLSFRKHQLIRFR